MRYLSNAAYDWTWVIGGAFLTLALPVIVTIQPTLLPAAFWAWIVFFEGSHFWATLSRTYFDKKFSSENGRALKLSFVFFAIPALATLHWRATGSKLAIDLWGFAIFVWSLFHNARQHYGFLNIYSKKATESVELRRTRVSLLYLAICIPQFYFLLFFKGPLALSFFPKPESLGALKDIVQYVCWIASAGVGAALVIQWFTLRGQRSMSLVYSCVCWVFYCVMFYLVAPREPFFAQAQNGAQTLMLLAVMNSLFHNIQYHAIVWFYARKRYVEAKATGAFGIAARINGSLASYLLVSIAMGAVFGWIVWGLGDWTALDGSYIAKNMNALSYILFFGIIGHHFFLDQFIWRPSVQEDLRYYLCSNTAASH